MTRLHRWPIFICYRRVDGAATARRLHDMLIGWKATDGQGADIELDPYLDENMPGVADWKRLHRPYLEKARAMIVVCTPGSFIDEGDDDWVHREIDWWIANRNEAPILVDPLLEEARFVPRQIAEQWPDIQRISLPERELAALSAAQLEQKAAALRRQVVGAILPSGAAIYEEELARERARAEAERAAKQRASRMLKVALGLLVGVVALGLVATYTAYQSWKSQQIAEAQRLDAQAGEKFQAVRQLVARRTTDQDLKFDLLRQLRAEQMALAQAGTPPLVEEGAVQPAGAPVAGPPLRSAARVRLRIANLGTEIRRVDAGIAALSAEARSRRTEGTDLLEQSDRTWRTIEARGWSVDERIRPPLPLVFTVEILPAGYGESLLIHYGPIDRPQLILVNAGTGRSYRDVLEPRLRELRDRNYGGAPVPIRLISIGDQDAEKSEGLAALLEDVQRSRGTGAPLVQIEDIWLNTFRYADGSSLRNRLRTLIAGLAIPLNRPFGRLVARPANGRLLHELDGGMRIMVVGPTRRELAALHARMRQSVGPLGAGIEPFPDRETPASAQGLRLPPPPPRLVPERTPCRPSARARALAGGGYTDRSVSNLASTILLFQIGGRTFLHSSDSRGDLILAGLAASGLLDAQGRIFVDLMNIPHFGSKLSTRPDFFARVRAHHYLVAGDGLYDRPAIEVLAGLVAARQCEQYRMIFTTRDYRPRPGRNAPGAPEQIDPYFAADRANPSRIRQGTTLDDFFAEMASTRPNYELQFMSSQLGSIFVNLLEPLPR